MGSTERASPTQDSISQPLVRRQLNRSLFCRNFPVSLSLWFSVQVLGVCATRLEFAAEIACLIIIFRLFSRSNSACLPSFRPKSEFDKGDKCVYAVFALIRPLSIPLSDPYQHPYQNVPNPRCVARSEDRRPVDRLLLFVPLWMTGRANLAAKEFQRDQDASAFHSSDKSLQLSRHGQESLQCGSSLLPD